MILDTHKEIKKLIDVGMEEKLAEAIVDLRIRSDTHKLWTEIERLKHLIQKVSMQVDYLYNKR